MQGIVLKTIIFQDKHLIIRILSDKLGKVSIFGGRNRSSKGKSYSTRLEPFDWGTFELTSGKGDLHNLKFFRPAGSFPALRDSLSRLTIAALLCECTDALLADENESDSELFEQLKDHLEHLVNTSDLKFQLKTAFSWLRALLIHSGLAETSINPPPSLKNLLKMLDVIESQTDRKLQCRMGLNQILKNLEGSTPSPNSTCKVLPIVPE